MYNMIKVLYLFGFLFLYNFSFGQKYSVENIKIENEVPYTSIYDIKMDSLNRMWIATDIGIVRFNGNTFDFYNKENGLLDNTILKIDIDDKGIIWFATLSGKIFFYKENKFQTTPFLASLDTLTNKAYYKIYAKNNHLILLSNTGKAHNIDLINETISSYNFNLSDESGFNLAYNVDSNGVVIEFLRIPKLNANSITKVKKVNSKYSKVSIGSFFEKTINGLVPIMMNDTLFLSFGSKFVFIKDDKVIDEYDFNNDLEILTAYVDGNDIWIGTFNHGLYKYSKKDKKCINLKSLEHNSITKIIKIDNEKFVVGTLSNGLYYLSHKHIFNLFDSLSFNTLIREPNFLANDKHNIYSVDFPNRKIKSIYTYAYGVSRHLIDIGNGNVLAIGNGLLSINKKNEINLIRDTYTTCGKRINDKLFIGFPYLRIDVFNLDYKLSKSINIFNDDRITAIENFNEKIYFGARDGFYYMPDTSVDKVIKLENKRIKCIYSFNNLVLVGTRFSGLMVYRQDSLVSLDNFGYKSLSINSIVSDDSLIYLSTNYGLIITSLDNDSTLNTKIISKADGLQTSIINSTTIYGDSIILLTSKGIYIVDKDYKPQILIPNIYFEKVSFQGRINNGEDKVLLKPYDNAVNIKFGSSVYGLNAKVDFYYRLINDGTDWHKASTLRLSVFNLEPKDYELEIYSTYMGQKSKVLKLSFSVDKPYYLKFWFISILFVLVSILLVFLVIYRKKKKKLVVRLLQNELDMIQKQLNPHFVANALNGLQSLILDNDFMKTNIFISNFSNLLRFSLRYSKKLFINLNEELNYIESFIKLHQITNRNGFEYQIHISKDVELMIRNIMVPPFFLQPIVENAIIHGFQNDSKDNILIIEIVFNDKLLEIRIVDNGVGYNNKTTKSHGAGMGISSIYDRISIYKDLENYNIDFFISASEIQDFGTVARLLFEKNIYDEREI